MDQLLLPVFYLLKAGAVSPIIRVINEEVKKYWAQCRSLGHTTGLQLDFVLLTTTL